MASIRWSRNGNKNLGKTLQLGGLVLLYDSKFLHHLNKLWMNLLGPFQVDYIMEDGVVKFHTLFGFPLKGLVNGNCLNCTQVGQLCHRYNNKYYVLVHISVVLSHFCKFYHYFVFRYIVVLSSTTTESLTIFESSTIVESPTKESSTSLLPSCLVGPMW